MEVNMNKSIGRLVSILHRQSQIYINYVLKDFNVTSAEYSFLFCLYHNDGMTQEKMSSVLYIDKAATARAIKSLEQKEYVIRIKDSGDKRINRVYLSEKAKKNIEEIRRRVFHWSEFLTEDLDPHVTDVVYDALEAMVNKVEDKKEKYRKEEI
jgi:DNA-binding MarR family transcriptional regulator